MGRLSDRCFVYGDEDGGVGVQCWTHWDGGQPSIYHHSYNDMYRDTPEVVWVKTLNDMLEEIDKHEQKYHKEK